MKVHYRQANRLLSKQLHELRKKGLLFRVVHDRGDRKTLVDILTPGGNVVASGESRCHPDDQFNKGLGFLKAGHRALAELRDGIQTHLLSTYIGRAVADELNSEMEYA